MKLKKFNKNESGRDFIIGDLHGEYDKLLECMESVGFDDGKDRLFSVGDLVDRGKDSEKCLNLLKNDWFHSVRGNHEQMLIDAVNTGNKVHWQVNGGIWANDYSETDLFAMSELAESMPIAMQINDIGIVHAEPPCDWDLIEEAPSQNLIWSRTKITYGDTSTIKNIRHVFAGHTPVTDIVTLGNVSYIDTGAVFGNKLTILEIKDE